MLQNVTWLAIVAVHTATYCNWLYNPRIHAQACRKVFLFLLSAAICTVVALNSAFPFRGSKERLDPAEELSMLRSLPALR